ncbi:MAG: triose-phosphate isomerase [Planctomycetaceae bacterium]|nr:triose-phosphate isomerase [Planctomycetaceae bacterium]
MRQVIVAGNWKMNTNKAEGEALVAGLKAGLGETSVEVIVFPPFPYLGEIAAAAEGSPIKTGSQDLYIEDNGAYTGEVSTEMLKDVGCSHVLVGHSERRHVLGECNKMVNKKTRKGLEDGMKVVLCVGELIEERQAWQMESVLDEQMSWGLAGVSADQMADIVIAYEPVWAIGTGLTATPAQAEEAHLYLRKWLELHYSSEVAENTRILYGGSVKPDNAVELIGQPNVDGALVGGASLKADSFLGIIAGAGK